MNQKIFVVLAIAACVATNACAPSQRVEGTEPLSIKLDDSGLGHSLTFEVKLDGTASLQFVKFPSTGQRQFKVTSAQMADLRDAIETERFFELENEYGLGVPDGGDASLTIQRGVKIQTVRLHYLQGAPNMSEIKRALRVLKVVRDWFNDKGAPDSRPYHERLLAGG